MSNNKLMFGLVLSGLVTGCYAAETKGKVGGVTRGEYAGQVAVVFTNASPEKMCELHMAAAGANRFGDNWIPDGLPTGKSAEFKVKPGKYKATWSTCKTATAPIYAATLTGESAFEVKEATQLFAFVPDKVAPTKRAAPRDFHAMVKFIGQPIDFDPRKPMAQDDAQVSTSEPQTQQAEPAKAKPAFDQSFIDSPKSKAGKKKTKTVKPSLTRTHDVAAEGVRMKQR